MVNLLISKVQYKRSEKGEFHNVAIRDLTKTLALIRNYPWDTERNHTSVELTCPSVTIEHPQGTYLKIGPYFSGKFCLYYLNIHQKVYIRTADSLTEVCNWVKTYFHQDGKLSGLKQYTFTIKPIAHFRTNPFIYKVDKKAASRFFSIPIIFTPVLIFLLGFSYFRRSENFSLPAAIGVVLFLSLFIWGPLIYFYFHYLEADKNHHLQISKGHDVFEFGTEDNKRSYKKDDIIRIDAFVTYSIRSPWRECRVFIISFKNNERLVFTSLLISAERLKDKFPDHFITEHKKFLPTLDIPKTFENKSNNTKSRDF